MDLVSSINHSTHLASPPHFGSLTKLMARRALGDDSRCGRLDKPRETPNVEVETLPSGYLIRPNIKPNWGQSNL